MRLRPNSGEINPEVGDCADEGTVRGAIYRWTVRASADALLMDGSTDRTILAETCAGPGDPASHGKMGCQKYLTSVLGSSKVLHVKDF